jgi:hypothetical protein
MLAEIDSAFAAKRAYGVEASASARGWAESMLDCNDRPLVRSRAQDGKGWMLRKFSLIAAGAVALFLPLPAPAGSSFHGSVTNPGSKYVPYGGGVGKFHTNPGGKYIYRGYGRKFHTNPGGKYVYPGWSSAPH